MLLLALLSGLVVAALAWPMGPAVRAQIDWRAHAAGPADELRVCWVGHSLMNARAPERADARNLIERVGDFARARGLRYDSFDHTIWGACLSMLWSGKAHGRTRTLPEMAAQRATLFEREPAFDALVLTETVPLESALRYEHSSWYAQQFACAVRQRNPAARVYVYECWSNLQVGEPGSFYPPASVYDWPARLASDRALWEQVADEAAAGRVPTPGLRGRLERWLGVEPAPGAGPLFLVPVGSVFRKLATLPLDARPRFEGRALRVEDLFANPYIDWPSEWPLAAPLPAQAERERLASARLRHPERAHDDIHPSDLGVYVASLTHFATLYRRSPEGLPCDVSGLAPEDAAALARLVWELVRNDPRTGVAAP